MKLPFPATTHHTVVQGVTGAVAHACLAQTGWTRVEVKHALEIERELRRERALDGELITGLTYAWTTDK